MSDKTFQIMVEEEEEKYKRETGQDFIFYFERKIVLR